MSAKRVIAHVVGAVVVSVALPAFAADQSPPSASGAPEADDADTPKPLTKEERERISWLKKLKISGFVQPQLLIQHFGNQEASPNPALPNIDPNQVTARADGTTTNQHFFRMRRARLKVEYWAEDWAKFVMEIDPFLGGGTSREAGTIARNVEAVGVAKWTDDITTEFGAGIFKVPFGFEILQSDADRPFIERSSMEQNLFPAEFEYGARAYTSMLKKKLSIQLAYTNGQMFGEKTFVLGPDPNNAKDFIGRVNYDFGVFDLGASAIFGKGEIVEVATAPATGGRTLAYSRNGFDFEAAVHHEFVPDLGKTKLFAEFILAKNLDRGTNYGFAKPVIAADPSGAITGVQTDLKEQGFFVRVEQELGKHFTIAARYDQYTPDTSLSSNTRKNIGGVFMIRMGRGLELRSEYAYQMDDVHKAPAAGKPDPGGANKKIHFMSYVLQARF